MLSLLNNRNGAWPAFVCANTASLAVIHICFKKTVFSLLYAAFRTEYITDAAFDAFIVIPYRAFRPPAASMIFTGAAGFGYNAADGNLPPGYRTSFIFHFILLLIVS
jgi:hypothetical protein